jgi:hypothetical protein
MARLFGLLCVAVALLGAQVALADPITVIGPGPNHNAYLVDDYALVGTEQGWVLPPFFGGSVWAQYSPTAEAMTKLFVAPVGELAADDEAVIQESFLVFGTAWTDWHMAITSGNAKFDTLDETDDFTITVNGNPVAFSKVFSNQDKDLSFYFAPIAAGDTVVFHSEIDFTQDIAGGDNITIEQYPTVPEPSILVALLGAGPVGLAGYYWRRKRAG